MNKLRRRKQRQRRKINAWAHAIFHDAIQREIEATPGLRYDAEGHAAMERAIKSGLLQLEITVLL